MALSVDKLNKIYVTFASSSTTAASSYAPTGHAGWIKTAIVTLPSFSAANISGTLWLYNHDGDAMRLIAANTLTATSTTVVSGLEWPVDANDTIQLRLNAIPGSAAGVSATPLTASVTFYLVP